MFLLNHRIQTDFSYYFYLLHCALKRLIKCSFVLICKTYFLNIRGVLAQLGHGKLSQIESTRLIIFSLFNKK